MLSGDLIDHTRNPHHESVFVCVVKNFIYFLSQSGDLSRANREKIFRDTILYAIETTDKAHLEHVHLSQEIYFNLIDEFLKNPIQSWHDICKPNNILLFNLLKRNFLFLVRSPDFLAICENRLQKQDLLKILEDLIGNLDDITPHFGDLQNIGFEVIGEILTFLPSKDISIFSGVNRVSRHVGYLELVRREYHQFQTQIRPDFRFFTAFQYGIFSSLPLSFSMTLQPPRNLVPFVFRNRPDIGHPSDYTVFAGLLGFNQKKSSQLIGNGLEYDLHSKDLELVMPNQYNLPQQIKCVFATNQAFAALLENGKLHCWGDPNFGGQMPALPRGRVVCRVYSRSEMFLAILDNKELLCWGGYSNYSRQTPPIANIKSIRSVYSTNMAFAVVFHDGGLLCWGDPNYGGITPSLSIERRIYHIYSTDYAFAAVLDNKKLLCWGHPNFGGRTPTFLEETSQVCRVYSTSSAFVALLNNGKLLCWGNESCGGNTPTFSIERQVVCIYSTSEAFAALFDNNTLLCWGNPKFGGTTPTFSPERKIKRIYSTDEAFAALFDNNTLLCWGNLKSGGRTPSFPAERKINRIYSTGKAFAAIMDNETLLCWGDLACGGKTPLLPTGRRIFYIYSGKNAFTALLDNGQTLCWGQC